MSYDSYNAASGYMTSSSATAAVKPASATAEEEEGCPHGAGKGCVRCAEEQLEQTTIPFVGMAEEDIERVLNHLPDAVVQAMCKWPNRVVLAGGFIRAIMARESARDIDLFLPNNGVDADKVNNFLKGSKEKAKAGEQSSEVSMSAGFFRTPEAKTQVSSDVLEVQLIWVYDYVHPVEVPNQFDYTIAKAAVWFDGESWAGSVHKDFFRDLACKRLVFDEVRTRGERANFALRLAKLVSYGYKLDPASCPNLIASVVAGFADGQDLAKVAEKAEEQLYGIFATQDEEAKRIDDLTSIIATKAKKKTRKKKAKPKPKPTQDAWLS